MNKEDLFKTIEIINNRNICWLMVHVANCYLHWLSFFDNDKTGTYFDKNKVSSIEDIEIIYSEVDIIVAGFISKHQADYETVTTRQNPKDGEWLTLGPLQLITHTMTHEFHHKGQLLIMRRLVGYAAVDVDII